MKTVSTSTKDPLVRRSSITSRRRISADMFTPIQNKSEARTQPDLSVDGQIIRREKIYDVERVNPARVKAWRDNDYSDDSNSTRENRAMVRATKRGIFKQRSNKRYQKNRQINQGLPVKNKNIAIIPQYSANELEEAKQKQVPHEEEPEKSERSILDLEYLEEPSDSDSSYSAESRICDDYEDSYYVEEVMLFPNEDESSKSTSTNELMKKIPLIRFRWECSERSSLL